MGYKLKRNLFWWYECRKSLLFNSEMKNRTKQQQQKPTKIRGLFVCLFSVLYDGQTFLQAGTEPSGFRHLLNSNVIQTQCSVRMSWKLVVCSLPSVMLL